MHAELIHLTMISNYKSEILAHEILFAQVLTLINARTLNQQITSVNAVLYS